MTIDFGVLDDVESPKLTKAKAAVYDEIAEEILTPAKRDPFDPAPLIALLAEYNKEIDGMILGAQALTVSDDKSLELSSDMVNQAKTLSARVSKKHSELKRPFLDFTQKLDAFKKQITDRVQSIVALLDSKRLPYMQKKEQERQEASRKAAEEAARIQRELEEKARLEREKAAEEARQKALAEQKSKAEAEAAAKAAAAMVEEAPVIVIESVPQETAIKTDLGTSKLTEKWVGELVDIRAIPDACIDSRWEELKKAVQPFINAQVAAGSRNVPGFKIQKIQKIDSRVSRKGF